jgi:L-gulonolactone oxidase
MRINRNIRQNWAKTYTSNARDVIYPQNEEEIKHLIQYCNKYETKLRVVGGGDSYNDIFCPNDGGLLVSLEKYNQLLDVDTKNKTATFEGGMMMPDLIKALKKYNLSISNLGTNIFDAVAGSCSTGYHGSGISFGIFSTFVLEFQVITPKGERKIIKNSDKEFEYYGCALGTLGIITQITLQCEEQFNLEVIEEKMHIDEIEKNFVTLLTDRHFKFIWIPHTEDFMVWRANTTTKKPENAFKRFMTYGFYGLFINNLFHEFLLIFASNNRGIIPNINKFMSKLLLPKKQVSHVWESEWAFFLPHLLKQDVVEYAFDIKDTFKVFREVIRKIKEENISVDTPIEVRFVKKDNFALSPSSGYDTCWIGTKIHFPYYQKPEYLKYFTLIDEILSKYSGRPHFGKQFRIKTKDFKKVYPRWDEFWSYVDKEDPKKILQNDFIKRLRYS